MKNLLKASPFLLVFLNTLALVDARAGSTKHQKQSLFKKDTRNLIYDEDSTCSVGLVQVESTRSFEDTYSILINLLNKNDNVYVAKEYDAAMVARTTGVTDLPRNRVVLFDNPTLSVPLIQADRAAALDLPQKMHVYETYSGAVFVGYNTPKYLEQRYESISGVPGQVLRTIRVALRSLVANVAGVEASTIKDNIMDGEHLHSFHQDSRSGVFVQPSNVDFSTTYNRLLEAIPKNDLTLMGTVDHQAIAESKGLELGGPTVLLLVTRPAFDASLMRANPCSVVDFPLKILVTEDPSSGLVEIRMNNFQYLRKRHHISKNSVNEHVFDSVHGTMAGMMVYATV